jgi:hypothetical protein
MAHFTTLSGANYRPKYTAITQTFLILKTCIRNFFSCLLGLSKPDRTPERSSFSIEREWTKNEEAFFIEKSPEKFHDN